MTTANGLQIDKEPEKKLKYPKSVFFIISNEFCERFSYYGMRSVLALYLRGALQYDESISTIIYHVFVMLCYFTPIFGGIMADAWLGKFKTILYISILYATGNIVLSFGSVETISIPHRELSLLGLFLIAIGTGGIKPCVSSFGGDQFVLPEQEKQLQRFFSVFYFSINAGSVISSFLTPMLRELHCLGSDKDCYPLAFGLPAALMVVSICVFVCGSPMYKRSKPQGNIALEIGGCVSAAVAQKCRSKEKKEHWLDYADHKYSPKLIADIKVLMKLIYLFAPTIVFWALFEQQGSKWTFQATRMNGDLGWYVLQPDQMQTLNAVLVLIFIPLFESVVYPVLAKLRLVRTPLQKLCVGGFLAALAFVVSGILEVKIQNDAPVLPSNGQSELHLYNSLPCEAQIEGLVTGQLPPFGQKVFFTSPKEGTIKIKCLDEWSGSVVLKNEEISSYLLVSDNTNKSSLFTLSTSGRKDLESADGNDPRIRILYGGFEELHVTLTNEDFKRDLIVAAGSHQSSQETLKPIGKYSVSVNNKHVMDITLGQGGVYALMLEESSTNLTGQLFTLSAPNSVNILWQIPQYVIITSAEIMFSITGLEFSYSQSPESLKSIISSLWLLTDSLGNVLILIIEGALKSVNGMVVMFLYAGVMTVAMLIFTFLAIRYKYVTPDEKDKDEHVEPVEEQTRI